MASTIIPLRMLRRLRHWKRSQLADARVMSPGSLLRQPGEIANFLLTRRIAIELSTNCLLLPAETRGVLL